MLRFGSNDDKTILRKLSNDTLEKFKIFNSIPKEVDYNLVITGTVGSGKTTLLESLSLLLKNNGHSPINFPEFLYTVNGELSGELLRKKIDQDISPLTFQSYILDMWENTLKVCYKNTGVKLYERCVDDSVICFCNIDHHNDQLTLTELISLYDKLRKTISAYPNIPSYFNVNNFIKIQSGSLNENLQEILSIIESDIKNGINKRIIGVEVSNMQSFERIKDRNRDGENNYCIDAVSLFNNHYNKLFKFLENNQFIKSILDLQIFR